MDGVIAIDKPTGMTSHDVVDEVRRRLGTRKVGHAGTLDPDATGLLVVGVGAATRLLAYAQAAPKAYRATALFGVTTSTHDAAGEVLESKNAGIDAEDLRRVLEKLTGDIEQVPPMVSAVKVRGEKLYEKARRGEEIERAARPVTIYELELVDFAPGDRPTADLHVVCSGGTYVRTLIHDIGDALGCGAHMTSLRRTRTGGFELADAVPLDEVTETALRPLLDAVRELPRIELTAEEAALVRDGRPFQLDGRDVHEDQSVAVVATGELAAVYRRKGDLLVAERVVPS